MLSVLGFADDTNVLCRKRDASTVEEITIRTLLEVGEEAHPDKTERMDAGVRDDELPEGFSETVRSLGPWIDMNGGCVTDTATRLEKAREVWRKVKVKLPGKSASCFRRPSLRHFCLEQRYVRFPEKTSRNTEKFWAESYDTSATMKQRVKAR